MTFEQLECFIYAVQENTFFDAAEALHITQSSSISLPLCILRFPYLYLRWKSLSLWLALKRGVSTVSSPGNP